MAVLLNNNTISIYYGTKRIIIDDGGGSYTETDPTVPAWAKQTTKPTYTASEVGALPSSTPIPDSLSDLNDDSTHRLVTDTEKQTWNNKSDFSGSYNDLEDKPSIPAEQVNSDWSATSGKAKILNKPSIPSNLSDLNDDSTHRLVTDTEKSTWNNKSNFSGNYNDLSNKPTIPTVPTNVSAFNNDANYISQDNVISVYSGSSAPSSSLGKNGDIYIQV